MEKLLFLYKKDLARPLNNLLKINKKYYFIFSQKGKEFWDNDYKKIKNVDFNWAPYCITYYLYFLLNQRMNKSGTC